MRDARTPRPTSEDSAAVPGILRVVPRQADALAFGAAALVIVIAFGFVLSHTYAVTHADLGVDKALSHARVGAVAVITHGVYLLISPAPAILITACIAAIVWWRTANLRAAVTFGVVVAGSWIPSDIVKLLVHRHRPDVHALAHPLLPSPPDPSYPSGHVVFAASLAMAFIFLARGHRAQRWVIAAGVAFAIVVGLSVLTLGVHYPTDVIASLLWSVGASLIVLTVWNRYILPRTYRAPASLEGRGARRH